MNHTTITFTCIVFAGLLATAGCQSTPSDDSDASYETVPQEQRAVVAQKHYRAAMKLVDDGQPEQAIEQLKVSLEFDITSGPSHNNLGKLYFESGKLYLAAWEFQYAIKLMPHQPEPRNNLGLVLERVGRLNEALEQFEAAVQMAPDHPELLGNLVRGRLRRGDAGPDMIDLLQKVVMRDDRPEWVTWAKRELGERGVAVQP